MLEQTQEAPRWYEPHRAPGPGQPAGLPAWDRGGADQLVPLPSRRSAKLAAGYGGGLGPGNVVEAVERTGGGFTLGLQWHPEEVWERGRLHLRPFLVLVQAAGDGMGRDVGGFSPPC